MIPRLEAQERLKAITGAALVSGGMNRDERSRIMWRLHEQATGGHGAAKATPQALASMGIGVRVIDG